MRAGGTLTLLAAADGKRRHRILIWCGLCPPQGAKQPRFARVCEWARQANRLGMVRRPNGGVPHLERGRRAWHWTAGQDIALPARFRGSQPIGDLRPLHGPDAPLK